MQKLINGFHKIRCRCGTWAIEETDFVGNLDHITLGLGMVMAQFS